MNNIPNQSSFKIMHRLIKDHIYPYKVKLFLAIFFMVLVSICNAYNIKLIKPSLDEIFVKHNSNLLFTLPLLMTGISIVKGIAEFLQSYLIKLVGQKILFDLQMLLYKHLLHTDLQVVLNQSSGKIISRFTNDIMLMRSAVSGVLVGIVKHFLTVIFLLMLMFYEEPMLSSIAIIIFPLTIYPIILIGKRIRNITHSTQEKLGEYTSKLDETFKSIRVIKSYAMEDKEYDEVHKVASGVFKLLKKTLYADSLISPLIEIASGIMIAFVIWYGGSRIMDGQSTPGSIIAFIMAFISVYKPFKSISNLNTYVQEAISATQRLFDILDKKPNIIDLPNASIIKCNQGKIEFKNVTFSYDNKDVLHNLSMVFEPGKIFAIVGKSGAGKTSLTNLIVRFYDPNSGNIYIDGQNIKEVTLSSLRKNIALVTQDIMLFDASIYDNIAYAKPEASMEEVIQAAEASCSVEFIERLPEKYNTQIGPYGYTLSGGQKQRLSLARAILKNSKILILDEATSSLDPILEDDIRKAIQKFSHNRTIIIIAHRLSTIVDADKIFVFKGGELLESGNHETLLKTEGEYSNLYQTQLKRFA